nr:MAG TPA: hypothetical protein [Bacteriophage sp.]
MTVPIFLRLCHYVVDCFFCFAGSTDDKLIIVFQNL